MEPHLTSRYAPTSAQERVVNREGGGLISGARCSSEGFHLLFGPKCLKTQRTSVLKKSGKTKANSAAVAAAAVVEAVQANRKVGQADMAEAGGVECFNSEIINELSAMSAIGLDSDLTQDPTSRGWAALIL